MKAFTLVVVFAILGLTLATDNSMCPPPTTGLDGLGLAVKQSTGTTAVAAVADAFANDD